VKKSLSTVFAFVATATLPMALTAPAVAAVNPDMSNFTVDCLVDAQGGNYDLPIYGDSITVTLLNCQTFNLWDVDNTTNASIDSGTLNSNGLLEANESPEVITVIGPADIEIWDYQGETREFDVYLNFISPYEMDNPAGTMLADNSRLIPFEVEDFSVGTPTQIENFEEVTLGDVTGCNIYSGSHIYVTQAVNVNTAGNYTFRVTGVSPTSRYLDIYNSMGSVLDDPMIAVYTAFNPDDTNSGVVSCNDDLNDLTIGGYDFGSNDFNLDPQGNYIEGHYSYLETSLQPGNYTVLFTTNSRQNSEEWASSETTGTIYFDVWGPTGGLTLGALADTGVNPAFALWSGLALTGTGVAITVARRRAQRA
jgi:hypothetical protein